MAGVYENCLVKWLNIKTVRLDGAGGPADVVKNFLFHVIDGIDKL